MFLFPFSVCCSLSVPLLNPLSLSDLNSARVSDNIEEFGESIFFEQRLQSYGRVSAVNPAR